MENAPKKGMSKGCLILLIVGGIIVVLAVLALVTCWIYKDDLAKMGATTLIGGLKTELATHEYDEVDTAQFNAMADAFMEKLNAEEPLDFERYGLFMQTIQAVMDDQTFTADEVATVQTAFTMYYPELESLLPTEPEEPVFEEDSLSME